MVTCGCGKAIDKIPSWMKSIEVDFVCNNCPNRQTKNIAFVTLEPDLPSAAKTVEEEEDVEEVAAEEVVAEEVVAEEVAAEEVAAEEVAAEESE
jgi:hypothetical protein